MISIITPVHDKAVPYLMETYQSLLSQTYSVWQWVIVLNSGGSVTDTIRNDGRVMVVEAADEKDVPHNSIGRLKLTGCACATGDILVELDADDLLTSDALSKIQEAFANPEVAMVYSNSAEFKDGTWEPNTYSESFGWRTRPFFYKDKALVETIGWPISSQMMRFIFWAPNHVRAWRMSAYRKLGGHDAAIRTGDDHDLCCRFYIEYGNRGIQHIDECLYLYRVHPNNSCGTNNAEVQVQTEKNYLNYSRRMMIKDAKDKGQLLIDLKAGNREWPEFTVIDASIDLNVCWPFEDSSVGVIRATHVFESMRDSIHMMNEAYRVLAPGGWLLIEVFSTDGRGAFQNPTYRSFWNENSIRYYTDKKFSDSIPAYVGRFQNSRTVTHFPTEDHRSESMSVLQSDLIALKGVYADRPVGLAKI